MGSILSSLAAVAAIVALALFLNSLHSGHDPYKVCADRTTEADRDYCERMVDMANSAGW